MRVLGIESSCDETAIAIVSEEHGRFVVEESVVASQINTHAKFGGVVPEVAAREHVSAITPMLRTIGVPRDGAGIDAIAATVGPGLAPSLRVGVDVAKTLAWIWNKPLVAVNHLEGHLYSVWLDEPVPKFPALALLVSGGHTELILMRGDGEYELIGMTRDDAAGEAFDKVAKLLGLPYPGGPEISKRAEHGDPEAIAFPRPMIGTDDFDVSFSGLKTAVRNEVAANDHVVEDVAASFQQAVIDTLVTKTIRAVTHVQPASVILTGGVSANLQLREALGQAVYTLNPDITYHVPKLSLTGDNATMIAMAGLIRAKKQEGTDPLIVEANPNLRLA